MGQFSSDEDEVERGFSAKLYDNLQLQEAFERR